MGMSRCRRCKTTWEQLFTNSHERVPSQALPEWLTPRVPFLGPIPDVVRAALPHPLGRHCSVEKLGSIPGAEYRPLYIQPPASPFRWWSVTSDDSVFLQ